MPPGAPDYPVPDSGVAPSVGDSAPAEKSAKKTKHKRPDQSPVFKALVLAVFLFVIVGLSFGAYLLYGMFMGGDTAPVVAPVASTPAPAPASPPSSTAGQLVEQARQAAAAHDALAEGGDEVVAEVEDVAAAVDVPARVMIEDTASQAVPTVAEPRPEFMAWVSQARISGVREGSNPKAFINNILVQKGDVIDVQLGIIFDGVDAQKNLVIFKDGKGAIVGKKY